MIDEDDLPEILLPRIDIVFKAIFGNPKNKHVLINFLEAVLGKKIHSVQLLNPATIPSRKDGKLSILDIKAELDGGEIIDIEMQVRNLPEMRPRITYYLSGATFNQIGESGKYLDLKPVIVIVIAVQTLIVESEKCHNVFSMLEKDEHFPFNNLHEIHVLDLSRIKNEKNEPLFYWLGFINGKTKEEFMRFAKENIMINAAYKELELISTSKEQRAEYEARLKEQRDIWSIEDGAERRGRQEGRKEGRQEGRKEGRQEGMKKARKELLAYLKSGHSLEEAEKKFLQE